MGLSTGCTPTHLAMYPRVGHCMCQAQAIAHVWPLHCHAHTLNVAPCVALRLVHIPCTHCHTHHPHTGTHALHTLACRPCKHWHSWSTLAHVPCTHWHTCTPLAVLCTCMDPGVTWGKVCLTQSRADTRPAAQHGMAHGTCQASPLSYSAGHRVGCELCPEFSEPACPPLLPPYSVPRLSPSGAGVPAGAGFPAPSLQPQALRAGGTPWAPQYPGRAHSMCGAHM